MVSIASDRLEVQVRGRTFSVPSRSRLQVNAAFCSHMDQVMRIARAIACLASAMFGGCRPGPGMSALGCSEPPIPGESSHHEARLATQPDSAAALRGVAPLVFRIGPTIPSPSGQRLYPRVRMTDTLTPHLAPLGRFGDSTGVVLVPVPLGYTSAIVDALGYATQRVPLRVRPGYGDTILVSLARSRVCIVE